MLSRVAFATCIGWATISGLVACADLPSSSNGHQTVPAGQPRLRQAADAVKRNTRQLISSSDQRRQRRKAQQEQRDQTVDAYEDLPHALLGRFHQEGGHAEYKDLVIVVGGFNTTQQLFLLSAGYRRPENEGELAFRRQLSEQWSIGASHTTIYNMTSRTWTDGPPLPIDVNHNTLAVSPSGVLYSLSASGFIRPHVPRDPSFLPYLHSLDLEAFLRGEPIQWQERTRGHVAGTTGGFGCTWFRSRVYCVGGASSLAHVDNGYTAAMTSYDPGTDTWQAHAPCPEAHHHAEVFVHEGRLWIVGGMGRMEDLPPPDKRPWLWPHYMRPTSIFASYDPETDTWSCAYRQLPSTMYAVQAQLVVRPAAEGGGSRTTLVAVGGQHTVGEDGIALQTVVEYDFGSDVWFCHPPLPRASFGGGHGFLAARQEMHIVGGADRYRMAPIDSVLVMHLDQLTDFQACMFSDHWQGWFLAHPGHSTARHHPYKGHQDPLGRTIGRARRHSRRELRAVREVADL